MCRVKVIRLRKYIATAQAAGMRSNSRIKQRCNDGALADQLQRPLLSKHFLLQHLLPVWFLPCCSCVHSVSERSTTDVKRRNPTRWVLARIIGTCILLCLQPIPRKSRNEVLADVKFGRFSFERASEVTSVVSIPSPHSYASKHVTSIHWNIYML
jgi:hypothetical protein